MNIEKMTAVSPAASGFLLDARRPIIGRALEIEGAHRVVPHRHPRAQLVYAIRGVFRVVSSAGAWVVSPSQAVWVPPDLMHEVIAADSISIRTLFVDPSVTAQLPQHCCVLFVSALLRELILKAVEIGEDYSPEGSGYRVMGVIQDLLKEIEPTPMHLPMGRDSRLIKVMNALYADPTDSRGLDEWAQICGASARTLARLFSRETGMTFANWRRQLRLLEAIDRLGRGQSVTRVALDLGYQSPSAFIAMFRRSLGQSPSAYLRREV
jgi:AraC-like DNA-binding protein